MKSILSGTLFLALIVGAFWQKAIGQGGTVSVSVPKRTEEIKRQQTVEDAFKRLENSQSDSFETNVEFYRLPELRLTKEQKIQTTPSKEELTAYANFLKLPKTGIFKLLPNLCGDARVIDVRNEKCLTKDVPSISFYSFRRKLYDSQDWADLNYQDKQLLAGFKSLTIGLIAEIGEIQIESLNSDSNESKSLLEIQMPKKIEEINAKKEEIKKGIDAGTLKLSDKTEIKLNRTYILRSFAYRTRESAVNDKRIDIIIAFRIIGIDENGGLTIIWKELYKGNSHLI